MFSSLLFVPLLAIVVSYCPVWDGPRPQIPELTPEPRPEIAPEDNAYTELESFLKNHQIDSFVAIRDWQVSKKEDYSLKQLSKILEEAKALEELIQRMNNKPYYQEPPYQPKKIRPFKLLRTLAFYQSLRTTHALQSGDPGAAMKSATDFVTFSTRMVGNNGSLVQAMISVMVLGMALENAEDVLTQTPETKPNELIKALLKIPDMRQVCWQALEMDFQYALREIERNPFPLFKDTGVVILTWDFDAWWLKIPTPFLFYQPNNTVRLMGDMYLKWQPYLRASPKDRSHIPAPGFKPVPVRFQNYIGISVANESDYITLVVTKALKPEAHAHALILIPFLQKNKRPPDSWILDPFTGQPLTVSKDGTRILSAGLDQKFGTEDDLTFTVPDPK